MKRVSILFIIGVIVLIFVLGVRGGTAVAKPTQPTVALGEPGLAFRFTDTFGTTGEPYIADGDHLNGPYGIGVDSSDNVWVGEWAGARAVKYNSSGVYQMSIGQAGVRIADNNRNLLNSVADTAVDGSGNIWLADPDTYRVVKYNAAGEFQSQLGVTWESGSDNDHFDNPRGVGFDSSGNLYVSDNRNHRIQVFDSSGVYTATIGISGVSGADNNHLYAPRHFTIDSSDLLYVADMLNHRVQVFDVSNLQAVTYIATLGTTGELGSDNSHFNYPMGVAVDSGRIYVVDGSNNRVQVFDRATYAYQSTLDVGSSMPGSYLADIAIDSLGNMYVVDSNMRVQVYDSSLTYLRTIGAAGVPYLTDTNHYNAPHGVAATSDGGLVVVEDGGHRLIKLDGNGTQLWTVGDAGLGGSDTEKLRNPLGVAEAANGDVYVADAWNNRVQIFDANGNYQDSFGSYGSGNDQFSWPTDIAFDPDGNFYVVDTNNYRVQMFDSSHNYLSTLGTTGVSGSDDSHYGYPLGVAVDSSGVVYVADEGNNRVQVYGQIFTPGNHLFIRTMGVTGVCGDSFDHFCGPHDVDVDAQDRLYVADTWSNRIQVFDAAGAYLTTISGSWGEGVGQMRGPKDMAVAADGTVYVAESENYRIQKFAQGVPGWRQVNLNGFGERSTTGVTALELFSGQLYAGASNWDNGGQVWRTTDGVTWTAVSELGFSSAYTNTNPAVIDMITFNGQLYASTGWGGAGQIWRSANGTGWTQVEAGGFGNTNNDAISTFATFNNQLYAATGNTNDGLEIWRSSTGDNGSWSVAITGGFNNDSNNNPVCGFAVFNGYLYAAVENMTDGVEIWRTNDGATWTQANTNGFGDTDNKEIGGLTLFDGYLYSGARNDTTGAQLWRSSNGTTWTQVVGDGFGDSNNRKLESLTTFAGDLYAVVGNYVTGMTVWRSPDGVSWTQINPDGFGDSNNTATLWANATTTFDGRLFIGSWNVANGGEIWQMMRQVYLPAIIR